MTLPNVRLTNKYREQGGDWYIEVSDTPANCGRLAYALTVLADYRKQEPASDWHLETRGDQASWHRWRDL